MVENVFNQYLLAESLINNKKLARLSPDQLDEMKEAKSLLFESMYNVAKAGQSCFDKPLTCEEHFLEIKPDGIHPNRAVLYSNDFFSIRYTTFEQFCDKGLSRFSTEDFQRTIKWNRSL